MSIHSLNITKSGNGTGTITSDPGVPPGVIPPINCGSTCAASVTNGITITLTATPDPGSVFVRWTGDLVSSSNPVVFVQPAADAAINAEFRKKNRRRNSGGTIARSYSIYLNDQQMEQLVNTQRFSNVVVVQRNMVGLGGSTANRSITIPKFISNGGGAAYAFSGIVDSSGMLQNTDDPAYKWHPGFAFYRYTIDSK